MQKLLSTTVLLLLPAYAHAHGSTLAAIVSLVVNNLFMYLALLLASWFFSAKGKRLVACVLTAVCYPLAFFFLVPLVANLLFSGRNADMAWSIGMYAIFGLSLLSLLYSKYAMSKRS